MPFLRRNKNRSTPPPPPTEPQVEERFFEEQEEEPSPTPSSEAPVAQLAEPEVEPEPLPESAEVHDPEPQGPLVGDASPSEDSAPEPEIDTTTSPAAASPLPRSPAPESPLPTAVTVPEPTPSEPAPAPTRAPAHARASSLDNFAERAQVAMGKLADLPSGNGARGRRPLPRVMAIANQKGGVGKTTTTVNLGAALSELDYRVLVVDLDPQGNATSGLGIDTRNFESSMYDVIMRDAPIEDCIEPTSVQNLFVTPATIDLAGVEIELVSAFSRELKLKRAIETVVDDFDFVLIDCPPSLGLLTINGLAAATEVLVPIQCEYYALEGLSQLLRNVQLVASNLNTGLEISAIVLTMFDARTRLAIDVADEVRSHFKEVVCRSIIPRTVRLSEAPSFGQPITVFDPSSRGAVAYRELAKEVSDGAPKRSG